MAATYDHGPEVFSWVASIKRTKAVLRKSLLYATPIQPHEDLMAAQQELTLCHERAASTNHLLAVSTIDWPVINEYSFLSHNFLLIGAVLWACALYQWNVCRSSFSQPLSQVQDTRNWSLQPQQDIAATAWAAYASSVSKPKNTQEAESGEDVEGPMSSEVDDPFVFWFTKHSYLDWRIPLKRWSVHMNFYKWRPRMRLYPRFVPWDWQPCWLYAYIMSRRWARTLCHCTSSQNAKKQEETSAVFYIL